MIFTISNHIKHMYIFQIDLRKIKPPYAPPKKEFISNKIWEHILDTGKDSRESIANYVKGWSFINHKMSQ